LMKDIFEVDDQGKADYGAFPWSFTSSVRTSVNPLRIT